MGGYKVGNSITCCYQCPDRFPCCHGSCEKYITAKAANNAKNEEIRKKKAIQQQLKEYKYDGIYKTTRSRTYRSKYRKVK